MLGVSWLIKCPDSLRTKQRIPFVSICALNTLLNCVSSHSCLNTKTCKISAPERTFLFHTEKVPIQVSQRVTPFLKSYVLIRGAVRWWNFESSHPRPSLVLNISLKFIHSISPSHAKITLSHLFVLVFSGCIFVVNVPETRIDQVRKIWPFEFLPFYPIHKPRLRLIRPCVKEGVDFTEVHMETDYPILVRQVGELIYCPSYFLVLRFGTSYLPLISKVPDLWKGRGLWLFSRSFLALLFYKPMNFFSSVQSNGKILIAD